MNWLVSLMQHHPWVFLAIAVGAVYLGVYALLLGLCMAASRADRQIDRLRREHREQVGQRFVKHGLRKVGD